MNQAFTATNDNVRVNNTPEFLILLVKLLTIIFKAMLGAKVWESQNNPTIRWRSVPFQRDQNLAKKVFSSSECVEH